MKILLIDNYDSFTYNLFHYLSSLKTKVQVYRNDKINTPDIIKKRFDRIQNKQDKVKDYVEFFEKTSYE